MADFFSTAKRILVIGYLIVLHAVVVGLLVDKFVLQKMFVPQSIPFAVQDPAAAPQVTPTSFPADEPPQSSIPAVPSEPAPQSQPAFAAKIIIPVQGVTREKLIDTFSEARSEGRVHNAIDIAAPAGTPVLAAADGEIIKFHDSAMGGTTIYQISADRKYFFYYAHLQNRAAGISEKQFIKQGTTLGFVGDTGNAGTGNFHLHFSISVATDPARFWEGLSINPYPILKGEADIS